MLSVVASSRREALDRAAEERPASARAAWRIETPSLSVVAAIGPGLSECRCPHTGACAAGSARIVLPSTTGDEVIAGETALRAVLAVLEDRGIAGLAEIDGSYRIAAWLARSQRLILVSDPFATKPLYYRSKGESFWVADEPKLVSDSDALDAEYVASFIASGGACFNRTIWHGVHPVPPGCVVSWSNGQTNIEEFWVPSYFGPGETPPDVCDASAALLGLARKAVNQAIDPFQRTWADLSGGLDSASVVALAQTSGTDGLGGTITHFDALGDVNDAGRADDVLRAYPLSNSRVSTRWPWDLSVTEMPLTEEPSRDYPYVSRDLEVARALQSAGATSILSGVGPDWYFQSSGRFLSDQVWSRQWALGLRSVARRSVLERETIWAGLADHVILPVMPQRVQAAAATWCAPVDGWLTKRFLKESNYMPHWLRRRTVGAWPGMIAREAATHHWRDVMGWLRCWRSSTGVDVRHPLLTRPLVEFCLELRQGTGGDQSLAKRPLRAAMKGIVPESIRTRESKGSILGPRIRWALQRERDKIVSLMARSALVEHGWVEKRAMLASVDRIAQGADEPIIQLYSALSLETWLRVRADWHTRQHSVM